MKTIKLIIAIISLATVTILAGCSGGSGSGTGTPGNSKVGLKVVFLNNSSVTPATGTMQDLGIGKLMLSVIPVNSTSYAPPQVDLSNITTGSYKVDNLTDNETYIFRILAYDAANSLIWAGESPAAVLPAGISVTVNSLKVTSSSMALLSDAKTLLTSKNITDSKDKLMLASLSDQQNNEAKLYYALARIINIYDNVGNTNSTQMDSIKKILEASGITYLNLNTLSNVNHPKAGLPKQLLPTTPTTGQVRDYVRYYLLPEIDAALITLSGFSPTYSATFSPAAYNLNGSDITIDYADVQAITTLLQSAKSGIALACAYNFDVNIVNSINKNVTDLSAYNKQTQGELFDAAKVLQNNPKIGTIQEAALLATAKAAYDSFVKSYETAFTLMKARTAVSQYLFVLDSTATNGTNGMKTKNLTNALDGVKQIQNALNGQTTLTPGVVPAVGSKVYSRYYAPTFTTYSAVRPSSNNTVNFAPFFNVNQPINLRTAFIDCATATLFKDKTFAGIYPLGYVTSPIYNDGYKWSRISSDYNGGWDIDPLYHLSGFDKQTLVNGLCGAGTLSSISGRVTNGATGLGGITISTAGGSGRTDWNGNYSISALTNGVYELTATGSAYNFTPASLSVTVNGADVAGKNFTTSTGSLTASW
jgi:hypothetical protein